MNPVQKFLFDSYNERRAKNPRYSLRSFSRTLGVSPSYLSMVFSGQRVLPDKKFQELANRLGLSPFEADLATRNQTEASTKAVVTEDRFRLIADWRHFAIVNLSKVKGHRADSRWIARRLGIDVMEAAECLQRLQALGLISILDGKIAVSESNATTSEDIPSGAIRKFHAGLLHEAEKSLEEVEVSRREISSILLSIKKSDLPKMKQSLRKMQETFADAYEAKAGDEVYAFCLQLFPLTKKNEEISQ